MIGAAPAWATWLSLGLWGVALVVAVVGVVLARRAWRKVEPTVAPLLGMFAQPSDAVNLTPVTVTVSGGSDGDA